jgi:hypothetical protein
MVRSPSPAPRTRRGAIAVKVAFCMPVFVGIVAMAVDGGLLFDKRRQAQSAADAAAMAAACELYKTYTSPFASARGVDTSDQKAVNHARAIAAANGFVHDPDGGVCTVEVNIPPTSGAVAAMPAGDQKGFAEVIITYNERRRFSSIFGGGDVPVRARAVAKGTWEPARVGILILDPTGARALTVTGNGQGIAQNAPVIVNSNHATEALYASGTGASITAPQYNVVGGYTGTPSIHFPGGPITTGTLPMPDPFRNIPQPDPTGMPARSKATSSVVNLGSGNLLYTLQPGVYDGGLLFSGKESVVMTPGIYYMRGNSSGGGFKFSGQGSLTATGVMVFNDRGTNTVTNEGSTAFPSVSISGQGAVAWTPPTDGTYRGMTLFQARGQTMTGYIAGGGAMNIAGSFYFPNALLDIAGGGSNTIGTQMVTWRLLIRGNGVFTTPWSPNNARPIRELMLIE